MNIFLSIYVDSFFNRRKTPDFKQGRGSTRFGFFLKLDFMTQKSTILYADHF
jgi:hypothetical protein